MKYTKSPRLKNRAGKVGALIAASLLIPALTYAGTDNGNGNNGQNNGKQYGWGDKGESHRDKGESHGDKGESHGDPRISSVPETNTGIVLIPFVGAVLLFSSLQLMRRKSQ